MNRPGAMEELFSTEMSTANRVQRNLLPGTVRPHKSLEHAGACVPAGAVGGDYFDFIPLARDRMALVLADVSGKGVPGLVVFDFDVAGYMQGR